MIGLVPQVGSFWPAAADRVTIPSPPPYRQVTRYRVSHNPGYRKTEVLRNRGPRDPGKSPFLGSRPNSPKLLPLTLIHLPRLIEGLQYQCLFLGAIPVLVRPYRRFQPSDPGQEKTGVFRGFRSRAAHVHIDRTRGRIHIVVEHGMLRPLARSPQQAPSAACD